MADYMLSSPAVSGGRIFIRTTHYLYAIEQGGRLPGSVKIVWR